MSDHSYLVGKIMHGNNYDNIQRSKEVLRTNLPEKDPSIAMWVTNMKSSDKVFVADIKRIDNYDVCLMGRSDCNKMYWVALNRAGKNPFDVPTVMDRTRPDKELDLTALSSMIKITCDWCKKYGVICIGSPSPRKASAYVRLFLNALLTSHPRFANLSEAEYKRKNELLLQITSVYRCLVTMYTKGVKLKDKQGDVLSLDRFLAKDGRGFVAEDFDFENGGEFIPTAFINRYVTTEYPGNFYVAPANTNDLISELVRVKKQLGIS
jgi:hypothetical protein